MTDAEMWMHRDKLRSTASQVTMWCGIIALHQEDGIGKDRLNKLTQGIMEAENAAALQIVELGMAEASRRLQREMHGICEISFHVPYVKRPKKHQELKDQMEKDAAATFGWLVLAKAMHKTYGYGKDRLARLYKNTQENYRQFVVWYAEDESWAYEKLRQCIARALQEEIVVVPDDYGELTFTLASEQQEAARQIKTQVFNYWPAYEKLYIQTFDRMLEERRRRGKMQGNWMRGGTGKDVFRWWMEEDVLPGQMSLYDYGEG